MLQSQHPQWRTLFVTVIPTPFVQSQNKVVFQISKQVRSLFNQHFKTTNKEKCALNCLDGLYWYHLI